LVKNGAKQMTNLKNACMDLMDFFILFFIINYYHKNACKCMMNILTFVCSKLNWSDKIGYLTRDVSFISSSYLLKLQRWKFIFFFNHFAKYCWWAWWNLGDMVLLIRTMSRPLLLLYVFMSNLYTMPWMGSSRT